ncbi:MAG: sigma factor-like helix-turn-helix DNA-binding protein, partial [Dehalococcoidia bacterium]
ARNLLRDHAKKLGRRGIPDELDELKAPAEPDAAAAVDLRHDLSTAMRSLTADQQEVIVMRFLLDKSVVETAELMSRSEDAVKNLQRRALAAMLRALAEAGYPGAVGT